MFEKVRQMNPQTIRTIKVITVVVGIVAGAAVVGAIAYKMGVIGTSEVVEEIVETAASAAS